MKAKLIIPKGFKLVRKPKFVKRTFILSSNIGDNPDLFWRDEYEG